LLIWIDIETNGLEPDKCKILEVACVITNDDLTQVGEFSRVIHHREITVNGFIFDMHSKNGLLEEVLSCSDPKGFKAHPDAPGRNTIEVVELELLEWVKMYTKHEEKAVPLAGSSVHFDRAFLAVHMPELEGHLHYRNVDVSTVKEIVRRFCPELPKFEGLGEGAHRAYADIQHSIAELRYYQEHTFLTEDAFGNEPELGDGEQ
jgi:oligoribonuclease